jgi:transcriptional regulator with XRE-family HTH domain
MGNGVSEVNSQISENRNVAYNKGFGERVRAERRRKALAEDRDIRQNELADELGVSPQTIKRWEDGYAPDDPASKARIAAFFGVTERWLDYGGEREAAPERPTQSALPRGERRPVHSSHPKKDSHRKRA